MWNKSFVEQFLHLLPSKCLLFCGRHQDATQRDLFQRIGIDQEIIHLGTVLWCQDLSLWHNRTPCKNPRHFRHNGEHSQRKIQQPSEKAACISGEGVDRHLKNIIWTGGSALGRNKDFIDLKKNCLGRTVEVENVTLELKFSSLSQACTWKHSILYWQVVVDNEVNI